MRPLGCVVLAAAVTVGAASATPVTVTVVSKQRLFTAAVTHPNPLPVERLHAWTVRLFDRKHRTVAGARIRVTGDMPEHGHGLPTAPIAVSRGRGVYQLQGMMFQMPGRWYVQLRVHAANRLDTIRITFTIPA
jgi:YtkA-like protein